jgi:hypothetical protein
MRQVTVTADISDGEVEPTYESVPVILDQYLTPFQVTYEVDSEGEFGGTVQVTTTDPFPVSNGDFVEADFSWVTAPTSAPNATGFLGQPFRAIRISGASDGDTLTVIQAGVK